ncbi:MAG: replication-associated recombination protein A [Chloroflexi bacterium]|nr:replication-associated recombination protein A [Chloroflexota bacterium]
MKRRAPASLPLLPEPEPWERQLDEGPDAPLATRMRPRTLDAIVGQDAVLGPGRVLRRAIEADRLSSILLWGPPGSGKTTLARVIAQMTRSHFEPISAVASGVADLRKIVEDAQQRRGLGGQRSILFIDEIHRFNKAQQDVVLPYVEDGTITLIGATTENPAFEVVAPLLSRCRVYTLQPLTDEQVRTLVVRALADEERGIGALSVRLAPEAEEALVRLANGDARVALTALEVAAQATAPGPDGARLVTVPTMEDALQHRTLLYDKAGEEHYNLVSAFIKSMRASDADAALYWMARMLEGGEDPLFIVRRMVIFAAEDVGLADPQALVVATACQQAVHFVGMPEGFLPMAEACVYLATAPKSNSAYQAYLRALEDVRSTRAEPVPLHLRNAPHPLMARLGYGEGYRYPHDAPGHFVEQQSRPAALEGRRYYYPGDLGFEAAIKERLERLFGEKWKRLGAGEETVPKDIERTGEQGR